MSDMATETYRDAAGLDAELERWRRAEEALLVEMSLVHHGYVLRLVFDLVRTDDGVLRTDLDEHEARLTIEMVGVQRLHMEGDLTASMLDHPELIDWGLSEVAALRAGPSGTGLQLQVRWEGDRRIVVDARSARVTGPGDGT